MENISKSFLILFSLLILGVLSLIYSYLMALNPIVFLNVVIWYFFSSILIIPFSFSSINKRIKFIISLLISCSVVYIVYGIKSSIFFVTYKSAIMDGGSMWFPKINLEDLFSTLISFSEYKLKLAFLTEHDTLNISFKGRNANDTGLGFTNFIRIIECLGFFIIPFFSNYELPYAFIRLYIKNKVDSHGRIGNQIWMQQNLNVDRFQNGDIIPEAKTNEEWIKAGDSFQPAWCFYDNKSSNGVKFGRLYNWYAINDPRGLAPEGWRIPSNLDWTEVIKSLGGKEVAGEKMNSSYGWRDKGNGTNSSGFNGLPGGYRFYKYGFIDIGSFGYFWSSEGKKIGLAWHKEIICHIKKELKEGAYIRLLKDIQ